MVWQHLMIEDDNSFNGNSGTDTIKIPRSYPIGDLALTIRAQNGGTNNSIDHAAQQTINESVEEIKVMAGSRVIYEASGQAAQDWNIYRTGRVPLCNEDQRVGGTYPSGWQESLYNIPFGRFPGDETVGLPAPLYGALTLKIKYDFTISATAGFATGTAKRDLYMDVMGPKSSEQLQAMRVLEHRKVRDHTTVSSGVEPFALTTDPARQLRAIMCSCYDAEVAEGVPITHAAFKVNNKDVFAKQDWNAIQFQNANDAKLKYAKLLKEIHSTATTYNHQSMIPNVQPIFTTSDTGSEDAFITTTGDEVIITMGSGENGVLACYSDVIPRCIFMDFDKNLSMRNLVNRNVLDLNFELTQGAAGGAVELHEMNIAPALG